ncbi:hypothetical protein [Delftia tsuruhatensis]|uniref:hypothetical protein n=1 Tax=Delftia tsuruhatensis TaxID=180282 RepID=UPI003A8A151C
MNQDTADLLLAAHVRDLASKIRAEDLRNADDEWLEKNKRTGDYVRAEAEAKHKANAEFREEWLRLHPLTGYVQNALRQLSEISTEIKRHTT